MLIPRYQEILKNSSVITLLRSKLWDGYNVILYDPDFVGCGDGMAVSVNNALIQERLQDTSQPFGYGLMVAAEIQGYLQDLTLDLTQDLI